MNRRSTNNPYNFPNEAAGIASGRYVGQVQDYSAPPPREELLTPFIPAYDGIFRTSYKFPPYNPDALLGRLGYDFMEDMLKMSVTYATFNLFRYNVLQDGWSVEPAVSDPLAPDHDQAKFYADALRFCLSNILDERVDMPQDFLKVVFDQLQACWMGFKASQIQYRTLKGDVPSGLAGKWGFAGFWSKPCKQMGFDIDPNTMNPMRFVSFTPEGGYLGDIHPQSVVYMVHNQSNNLPTGEGMARPVYKNWFALDVYQKLWAIALERWGAPVFIAKYPAGNTSEMNAAYDALNEMRGGAPAVIPSNVETELLSCPEKIFEGFEASCQWNIEQIKMTIHGSTLTMGEGKHGATSAGSEEHGDTSDTVYDAIARWAEYALNSQITRRWLKENWGQKALALCPKIVLRKQKKSGDIYNLAQAMNLLVSMGNMPATSKIIREELGVPPIDADEEKLLKEQKQAEQEAQERMQEASLAGKGPRNDGEAETMQRRTTTAVQARNEIAKRAA